MTDPTIASGTIQTALAGAVFVRAGWKTSRAIEALDEGDFDQAPVLSGRRIIGYALRADLLKHPSGKVRGVTRALDQHVLLNEEAPFPVLLEVLRRSSFAFLVGSDGLTGFVTVSDLNKQGSRAHFYLMIASVEVQLAELLRRFGPPQEDLLASLSLRARRAIRRRFREDKSASVEVDYLAYMYFAQLVNLVGRDPALLKRLEYASRGDWRRITAGLAGLRNSVMHPTSGFLGSDRSVQDIQDFEVRLGDLGRRLGASLLADSTQEPTARVAEPKLPRASRTQRITAADIQAGRIRVPRETKALLPPGRTYINVSVRGRRLTARWDPRTGPDRERSGVLHVGRRILRVLVEPNEVLLVSTSRSTGIRIDS
jgi:hypothetical protein